MVDKLEGGCVLCAGVCRGHSLGHADQWTPEPGSRAAAATPANGEQVERADVDMLNLRAERAAGNIPTPTEDARSRVKVLEEALEALMASSGARGTYDAYEYYKAKKEAERLLGNKETDRHG